MSRRSAGRAILLGGLICGVLDISSAIVIAIAGGGSPVRMLQGIAGALLGPVTYERGFATAAMGLDKPLETWLVEHSPDWLTQLTTRL